MTQEDVLDGSSSGVEGARRTNRARSRWIVFGWAAVTLLLSSMAEARIESAALRENSCSTSLLFWSSYDFSVDAATQFLGPLDMIVRGGDVETIEPTDEGGLIPVEANGLAIRGGASELAEKAVSSNRTNYRSQAVVSDKNKMVFSLFQKGDGSDTDPDGIPTRYLKMQSYNRDRAMSALEATLKWRAENKMDEILKTPQTKFDLCKTVFPHYFLGRDKDNHVVFLQRPALIDLQRGKKNKLTNDELLLHYVYVNEYLWQILEASEPQGTMISLLDLTGLDFSVLKKRDLIGFVKKFVATMDSHFPQRSHKTLILSAPKWFNALYKLFSPLLRETTKAKIEIHSRGKKQDEALRRVLGDKLVQLLPPSVWSKKHQKGRKGEDEGHHHPHHADFHNEVIPESELEKELRAFVSDTHNG
jgi:CRAL/TRIO domain